MSAKQIKELKQELQALKIAAKPRRARKRRQPGSSNIPAAMGGSSRPLVTANEGTVILSRSELFTEATVKGGSKAFTPASGSQLPFLARMAAVFNRIIWLSCTVEYKPLVGTQSAGAITFGIDWEGNAAPTEDSKVRSWAASLTPVCDHPVWQTSKMVLPSTRLRSRASYELAADGAWGEDKTFGVLGWGTVGTSSASAPGEFWVHYKVRLEGTRGQDGGPIPPPQPPPPPTPVTYKEAIAASARVWSFYNFFRGDTRVLDFKAYPIDTQVTQDMLVTPTGVQVTDDKMTIEEEVLPIVRGTVVATPKQHDVGDMHNWWNLRYNYGFGSDASDFPSSAYFTIRFTATCLVPHSYVSTEDLDVQGKKVASWTFKMSPSSIIQPVGEYALEWVGDVQKRRTLRGVLHLLVTFVDQQAPSIVFDMTMFCTASPTAGEQYVTLDFDFTLRSVWPQRVVSSQEGQDVESDEEWVVTA